VDLVSSASAEKASPNNLRSNYFNWRLVLGMCIAVYAVGVVFSLLLQAGYEPVDLVVRPSGSKGRVGASRGGGGGVGHRRD